MKTLGPPVLLQIAAFVVVVAGLKAAAGLVVPIVLALFLAMIAGPQLVWLQRHRVPTALGVVLIIVVMLLVLVGVVGMLGSSLADFTASLPAYDQRFRSFTARVVEQLAGFGIDVSPAALAGILDAGRIMKLTANMLSAMGSMLTNVFLILLITVFVLLEASDFPAKLEAGVKGADRLLVQFGELARTLEKYVIIKTGASLLTGVAAGLLTWAIGVDYPFLWGSLAFLLNFVPNIGSVIAAIPPVTLALVQLGPLAGLEVVVGYILINTLVGNLLEPRLLGHGVGLSPLVVFLSLLFWGWVLGPIGMVLSVPLTVGMRIGLEAVESTRWIAILLGPAREVEASAKNAVSGEASGS